MKRNVMTGVYMHNEEEKIFNFYTAIRAYDKLKFVNSVVDTLIDDNYYSVIRNIIFDYNIINIFTDIDTSYIQDSNDALNLIEDLLDETNIVEIVKSNVSTGLIDELNKAVDDAIEYRTGIHKNPIAESLSNLLHTIERKISGIDTNEMMRLAQTINDMTGDLTPEKILETYAKSDLFKEKYKEIVENREKNNGKVESASASVKSTRGRKKTVSVK